MDITSKLKYAHMSPLKLRTLVGAVKRLSPEKALEVLRYDSRRGAKMIYKAVHTAVADARHNFGIQQADVTFKTIMIDEGPFLKRYRMGSKGSAKPYVRKMAHITVVLSTKKASAQAQQISASQQKPVEKVVDAKPVAKKSASKKATKTSEKKVTNTKQK